MRRGYRPCPGCDAAVPIGGGADHDCERERRVRYELFHLRDGIAGLERDIRAYLTSPQGRFALWYASRSRSLDSSTGAE